MHANILKDKKEIFGRKGFKVLCFETVSSHKTHWQQLLLYILMSTEALESGALEEKILMAKLLGLIAKKDPEVSLQLVEVFSKVR